MKKKMILAGITLFVVIAGGFTYFRYFRMERGELSISSRIPISNQHEHVSPDGTVVEHNHIYAAPPLAVDSKQRDETSTSSTMLNPPHPWDSLNLAAIRRDYQRHTIGEMQDMWDMKVISIYGPDSQTVMEADNVYPPSAWLERMFALGHPFVDFSDYNKALSLRNELISDRDKFESRSFPVPDSLEVRGLPPDTPWEVYEESLIKSRIVHENNRRRWREKDPSIEGGVTFIDGTFIPFSPNTVHVHISPDTGAAQFVGVNLTREEKDALKMYGIPPEGIDVIYVDENNEPLPPGTPPPRFYEQQMKALEEAQVRLQQQIEYHEKMFELDSLLEPSEAGKQNTPISHDHVHKHDHTHETSQPPETVPSQHRQHPDSKQAPPQRRVPPELLTPDAVNQWFTKLEALHGGQLPKDLIELRKVIKALEKIRREGEVKLKPPQRPERPAPPLSPDAAPPEEVPQ